MDAIDQKLLNLMQTDAKLTTKALALQLNLSATAVYERLRKWERAGVIQGYVALLNKSELQRGFVVFCHVKLTQHLQSNIEQFEKQVVGLQEVMECYHVSGDYDYILKVCVADMPAYREFMVTKLTNLSQIGSTHSTFMIGEVKHTTAFEL
ncbi:MAG: AsnC family transcriptional regulator [Flavobacterium sp. BFFFF2]|nr:MAG: AsnC family transcriptional regulator [Flavobacterium sp. BFFFF2]